MKLVEIKNSLAKLYYEPADFPLVISDFLTIDDGNQKILSQVVSIESTSKDTTNCAILKFSLDLNADNTHTAYSGYVPPLDALVSKTQAQILSSIFSDKKSGITLGNITGSSKIPVDIKPTLMENFLYIQSDRADQTGDLTQKILDFNVSQSRKTLVIDFDGVIRYQNAKVLELGKDFKLPIDNETLDYIYENDLTGLTVEQKTIVQDIILEIQEYIDTLDEGYIPFNTLLKVVNDIYETDKSVGVILLRNKLLKYDQYNIFASAEEEVMTLFNSVENDVLTVLNVKNATSNWQKEALNFALNHLETGYYLLFDVKDDAIEKAAINKIYKAENIKPIISSKYDSEFASQLKSFAKNLILFKPESQQRAFATYNSFLNKLAQTEFIVSGEATYYTPLIVRELPEKLVQNEVVEDIPVIEQQPQNKEETTDEEIITEVSVQTEGEDAHTDEAELISGGDSDETPLELDEADEFSDMLAEDLVLVDVPEGLEPLEEQEENDNDENELKNIFEESLEQEIAKDVDKMFYAEAAIPQKDETEDLNELDDINDLNALEELGELDAIADSDELSQEMPQQEQEILSEDQSDTTGDIDYQDMFSEEDLDLLDEVNLEEETEITQEEAPQEENDEILPDQEELGDIDELPGLDTVPDFTINEDEQDLSEIAVEQEQQAELLEQDLTENESLPGIPIYSTEIDKKIEDKGKTKIAEGNIVYHEKYGRGVVEQLIIYGKKTLCSIQFDNVGRRLLDPNLADLKQM